jgi:hypothetical protein
MSVTQEAKSHIREVQRIGKMALGLSHGYSIGRGYKDEHRIGAVLWYSCIQDAVRRHGKLVKSDPARSLRLYEAITDAVRAMDTARNSNTPIDDLFGRDLQARLRT